MSSTKHRAGAEVPPLDVDHSNLDVVLARLEKADRPALLTLWTSRWERKVQAMAPRRVRLIR